MFAGGVGRPTGFLRELWGPSAMGDAARLGRPGIFVTLLAIQH